MTMTRAQIEQAAEGLEARDCRGNPARISVFARRIRAIDPVLGRTVELHVEAAQQGGSPTDIDAWIDGAEYDAIELAKAGIATRAAAAVYWYGRYTEMDPDEAEADEMFRAVYGRDPDDSDRVAGVFSLVCAGV